MSVFSAGSQYEAIGRFMFGASDKMSGGQHETEKTLLIRDATTALARPHRLYVYFHKSVYRVRLFHQSTRFTPMANITNS